MIRHVFQRPVPPRTAVRRQWRRRLVDFGAFRLDSGNPAEIRRSLHVERLHLQVVVRVGQQVRHDVRARQSAQHCHFCVLSGARCRSVVNEEPVDWHAIQIGILNAGEVLRLT